MFLRSFLSAALGVVFLDVVFLTADGVGGAIGRGFQRSCVGGMTKMKKLRPRFGAVEINMDMYLCVNPACRKLPKNIMYHMSRAYDEPHMVSSKVMNPIGRCSLPNQQHSCRCSFCLFEQLI